MIPELKQKWIEALRSGKYAQSQLALKNADGYCCLGVLCDIAGVGTWEEPDFRLTLTSEEQEREREAQEFCGYDSEPGEALPTTVLMEDGELSEYLLRRWGITDRQQRDLIDMNDNQKASFGAIADYIEANL